ncbi:2OG-Fe(II) oxygenase [Bacillus pseudomycoides]|uniref:prolyl hydroxylase family protein n=1 Tax=Bacillus pseudomycoides TaxID=64104 RepID=UPI000BEB6DC6|nr:2OG-Fe(II) oxygenase [Bacillus pseudomycoides]PED73373.1 2OG-Fe(II) oxygenase [Bacillus pseudomycoides]PEI37027.1 2OG-Fe(II) oxygenase [Bacillus pseudomycoides]PEJ73674.1 2OG-Fe(II) oxygenase [Bacillus pseudomycoides]PEM22798.1 2OG-Fe(II) oxygenase [Bacillus pseudomycoides]PEP03687.1 2OG-Fe(II) oxygenase [Bacillus pseudomycoides]
MNKMPIVLHDDPFVAQYEEIITPAECKELIELSKKNIQPAQFYGHTGERKSDFTWLQHYSHGLVSQVSELIATAMPLPLNHAEPLQAARYEVGGKFDAHIDCYGTWHEDGRNRVEQGGQRLYTAILYLNTVDAGGETFFPSLNLTVTPSEGKLLVFENCKRGTNEPHPLSLHEGCAVHEGEKWIATLWFREKPQY